MKPLIDQIIAQYVISADNMHQLSVLTSVNSWNSQYAQSDAASIEGARLSTSSDRLSGSLNDPRNDSDTVSVTEDRWPAPW